MKTHYDNIEANLSCPAELGRIIVGLLSSRELADHLETMTAQIADGHSPDFRLITSESYALNSTDHYSLYLKRYGARPVNLRHYEAEDALVKTHGVSCIAAFPCSADVTVRTYHVADSRLRPIAEKTFSGQSIFEDPKSGIVHSYECRTPAWMLRLNFGKPEHSIKCFDGNTLDHRYTSAVEGKSTALVSLCTVFGLSGDREALPYLAEIARDDAYFVRWAAIQAIGKLDAREAIIALRRAAEDPHETIRIAARRSLEKVEGSNG